MVSPCLCENTVHILYMIHGKQMDPHLSMYVSDDTNQDVALLQTSISAYKIAVGHQPFPKQNWSFSKAFDPFETAASTF